MPNLTVTAKVEPGAQRKPVATVDAGAITVTVYESLIDPGRICVEVDGQPQLMILYINEHQITR